MTKPSDSKATPIPHRPARADAQRNEERLVAVAREMFSERGMDAPLDDIAKLAGVGIGTLYRHFPTRQALIEAVMLDHIQLMTAQGVELLDAPSASEALTTWLHALVINMLKYQGVAKPMAVAMNKCQGHKDALCGQMRDAGAALLKRSQKNGDIRNDVDIDDVLSMVNALAWTAEQGRGDRVERMLAVVLNGLRPVA